MPNLHPEEGTCDIQVLRSSAAWSLGLDETEAIVERILQAHKNKEKFKVIVVMPLIPGFPAEIDSSDAGVPRSGCTDPSDYIGFYSLRNHDKIIHQAVKFGRGVLDDEVDAPSIEKAYDNPHVDPARKNFKYTKSNSASHHKHSTPPHIDENDCTYVTEELYIHSKLLIADDRIVIMGSGSSQNGDHDSEIAAIIEDKNYIHSRMAGEKWQAGKFAATLRRHIFKQHLGLEINKSHEEVDNNCHPPPIESDYRVDPFNLHHADRIVEDPVSDDFYKNHWYHTASQNTESFLANWDDFKSFVSDRTKVPLGHITEASKQNMEATKTELHKIKVLCRTQLKRSISKL
ncbi:9172_t:CDS:2 [Racocetra fulgida]|uniref:phospholipase D n=1 Tax=Racocetra fulgida TaxID=60492 RepID=A0A9N9AXQ1_9GLOM|nr:9172_t:CDS:2 [Racocetra fulgida]